MYDKIKYESYLVTFTEVPDEISLCFNISGCPCRCQGCFEPWLAEDIGTYLTFEELERLYKKHPHTTCICFMGGDRYYDDIIVLIMEFKRMYPEVKFAMYSGRNEMVPYLEKLLSYYKLGPFIEKFGPLNKTSTNQKFYKKEQGEWKDITYKFQIERI